MISARKLQPVSSGPMVAVAIILAAVATITMYLYIQGVRNETATATSGVAVIVAKEDIPAGADLDELIADGAFKTVRVPENLVVAGAVTSLSELAGVKTTTPILTDEMIPAARIDGTAPGGTLGIPKGHQALSVALAAPRLAGGSIRDGDHVSIYSTFAGPTGSLTVTIAPDVEVLDVSGDSGGGLAGGSDDVTVTLALKPADAQRVVFSQEEGSIWMALLAPDSGRPGKNTVRLDEVLR